MHLVSFSFNVESGAIKSCVLPTTKKSQLLMSLLCQIRDVNGSWSLSDLLTQPYRHDPC